MHHRRVFSNCHWHECSHSIEDDEGHPDTRCNSECALRHHALITVLSIGKCTMNKGIEDHKMKFTHFSFLRILRSKSTPMAPGMCWISRILSENTLTDLGWLLSAKNEKNGWINGISYRIPSSDADSQHEQCTQQVRRSDTVLKQERLIFDFWSLYSPNTRISSVWFPRNRYPIHFDCEQGNRIWMGLLIEKFGLIIDYFRYGYPYTFIFLMIYSLILKAPFVIRLSLKAYRERR